MPLHRNARPGGTIRPAKINDNRGQASGENGGQSGPSYGTAKIVLQYITQRRNGLSFTRNFFSVDGTLASL